MCVSVMEYLKKWNLKEIQGDTDHPQAQMLAEVYTHILNEGRKVFSCNELGGAHQSTI